ncbi:MAG: hypothetical protein A2X94_07145 [Bdellovibrionales bacterium GWB1_55_8]|nr:MAG: hypothetical protein A2X94_07145 [Bdellovibrionales bacterium GWB1_55_8]
MSKTLNNDVQLLIRKAEPSDWPAIRDICCKTGNSGEAIAADRWSFFSEQWVGPYQKLLPEWTYVAAQSSHVCAYLTGCPDTALLKKRKLFFDLQLALKIASKRFPPNADTKRFLKRTFRLDDWPEARFSESAWKTILSSYPAHLHINADAEFRGKGTGRALIDRFSADLRKRTIPGIHVFCGIKPVPFYERLGFQEIEKIEFVPGVWVYALGLAL